MNSMEEQLWEYIDGALSLEKAAEIEKLIATDERWKKAYQNELAFSRSLQQLDLDEPPMGFNYRVMEAIRTETALQPLKARINPYIIWAIGVFFLFAFLFIMSVATRQINWAQTGIDTARSMQVNKIEQIFGSKSSLQTGMFLLVVAALFFGDKLLNRKLHEKISAS